MFFLVFLLISRAGGFELPSSCGSGQFYDTTVMDCRSCNNNHSMVPTADGFGCTCATNSIRVAITRCRPCNSTELISDDGTACVPRRCQKSGSRMVCRKCPNDYISVIQPILKLINDPLATRTFVKSHIKESEFRRIRDPSIKDAFTLVTQNFDGSPMKEVTCFKCARGYRPKNNKCVECETCSCSKNEIIVNGKCLPKKYVMSRPKYNDNKLHPSSLLDIVKLEYYCSQKDLQSCHALAKKCVTHFYTSDQAGPCRLWIQPNSSSIKELPPLVLNENLKNEYIAIKEIKNDIFMAVAVHYTNGAIKILEDVGEKMVSCLPPFLIKLGDDYSKDCVMNISNLNSDGIFGHTYELFLPDKVYKPLPIRVIQPDGQHVGKGSWPSRKFRRLFLVNNFLSTNTNMSTTVYLRKLLIRLGLVRKQSGSLDLQITLETYYATKSPVSQEITTTLVVRHDTLSAGSLWGLQVWSGILSAFLSTYALVQWRTVTRRGGLQVSIIPLICGSVADGLYFATLLSTLHSLAAEAGALGITLPLSSIEENTIGAVTISVVMLKFIKVAWMNVNQCRCDIFFLDWNEYNPPVQDSTKNSNNYFWRSSLLAREWMSVQTLRWVCPTATITATLVMLHILQSWQWYVPKSGGYNWAIGSIAWWTSYSAIFSINWLRNRVLDGPTSRLNKVCSGVELSLLVFQEDYYAHYVHGRIEENGEGIKMPGPLASCRVVCAPQVRNVYKKLAYNENVFGENESNRILLTRFLAAFFERALDGLNWIAIERTTIERLLDIELNYKEGNTSTLLYDLDNNTPSCFNVTWRGEEWTLATFDAMLFGSILLLTEHSLMAALITLIVWQILKLVRECFAQRNLRYKTNVEVV